MPAEPLESLPTTTPPRQLRSRATMERVLTAVEELLVDKPFDQITIAEIAARASSSPTSIYARFTDKSGLLLAAHERFKHQAEKRLRAQIDSGELADLAPRQIFDAFVQDLVSTFRTSHNLLRSVVLADSPVMYERAAMLITTTAQGLAEQLRPAMTVDYEVGERCIAFAVRAATAVMQQHVIFEDRAFGQLQLNDNQLAAQLSDLLTTTTASIFSHG